MGNVDAAALTEAEEAFKDEMWKAGHRVCELFFIGRTWEDGVSPKA